MADVATTETRVDRETPAPRTGGRRWLVPVMVVLLVVTASAAGALAYFLAANQETSPQEVSEYLSEQRPAVEERAHEVLILIVNFDAATIDEQRDKLLEMTTGTFREQYEEAFQNLGEGLRNVAASSRGEVVEGPTVSFQSSTEAIALASLTETIQSNEDPQGVTFLNDIKLTLVRTAEGSWKADRAEILSTRQV